MVLDKEIKTQLAQYLNLLESDIVLQTDLGDDDNSRKVKEFLDEIAAMSDRISLESTHLKRQPSFGIAQKGQKSRVIFSGLPMGHEFTSFILALLQVSGRPPKVDEDTIERIKKIDKPIDLETYVSLTCHNCPDVVQAFNIMAVLNPNITHT
ncbi:MAG: alkyl hydroperoxide reductase subunit F, partial [Streptococcus salivarius]